MTRIARLIAGVCAFTLSQVCNGEKPFPIFVKARVPSAPMEFSNDSVQTCSGKATNEMGLERVKISAKDLEKGVDCLALDLDSNGSQDFILMGPSDSVKRDGLLLMFDGQRLIQSQLIQKSQYLEVFTEENSEKKNYPKFRKVPGLIKPASGDTGRVYFYDKATRALKQVPYVYPKDYESDE